MQKLLPLLLLPLLAIPLQAVAMSQPVFSSIGLNSGASGSTVWFGCGTSAVRQSSHALAGAPIAVPGTLGNLQVALSTAPGAGTTLTFTVEKNDVDTGQACSVSDANTTCSSATTVAFSAGDTCSVRSQATAGVPAASQANVSHSFVGDNAGESFISGVTGTNVSNSATQYYPIFGGTATTTLAHATSTMPTAGTIDDLYVAMSGTIAGATTYDVTIFKNGVSTGITCQLTSAGTTCSDPTNSASYVAGDSIAFETVPTGTPTARAIKVGVRFTPTVDGESVLFVREVNNSNVTRYHSIQGTGARATNEVSDQVVAPLAMQLKKFYLSIIYGQPTGAQTRTLTVRKDGASQSLATVISSSAAWDSDLSNTVDYTAGQLISLIMETSGTPPTTILEYWSMVAFVDPGGGGAAPPSGFNLSGLFNLNGWANIAK